jgi:hypothetical protein
VQVKVYQVWEPGNMEQSDAMPINARVASEAAEVGMEKINDNAAGEYLKELMSDGVMVHVLDIASGKVSKYVVNGEASLDYSANEFEEDDNAVNNT